AARQPEQQAVANLTGPAGNRHTNRLFHSRLLLKPLTRKDAENEEKVKIAAREKRHPFLRCRL
ncbi:MAG: hypothetical protein JW910_20295, partial [Anaerolineae bacterium]|nr:hypothetical protein [Anaerolineae bacterium]